MRTLLLMCLIAFVLVSHPSCSDRPTRVVIGIALTSSNHPAVELAAKEINDSGGIEGVPLVLMGSDWKVHSDFRADEIIKWANLFAETKDLVAVIGHSDSASTLSAAAVYNQQKVPQIVTIATNPAITNIGDWTYRLCLSDATQGVALAEYAVKDWGKKRISIFYVNDAYGKGLAEVFETEARRLGAKILSSRLHRNVLNDDDKVMIISLLSSLKKEDEPDLFVLIQRTDAANWTIRTIREAGFKADILGGDNLGRPDFLNRGDYLNEGIRVSQFYLPAVDNDRDMNFVQAYRNFTGGDPDYGNAFAYDAVYLVRDAVLKSGSSRNAVKGYLDDLIKSRVVVNGVGGKYRFGADHDARRTMYIVQANDRKYKLLKALTLE